MDNRAAIAIALLLALAPARAGAHPHDPPRGRFGELVACLLDARRQLVACVREAEGADAVTMCARRYRVRVALCRHPECAGRVPCPGAGL